ncbi:MAG: CDP-alcohol phosphatidyltransferase family protein [Chloroflexi bacterium]|nr:CDP-alcohol phosphatidyltransferase family protein [Chloroflexota bacterium]
MSGARRADGRRHGEPGGHGGSFVSPATRARLRAVAVPIALVLGRLGLTPNSITIVGFLGTCVAAVAAAQQAWVLAGVLVIAFGIFDLFDGALARATGTASAFGAFLDSTLDRTGENLVLAGVAFGSAIGGFPEGAGLAALAMATSSIVTYTRARAEAVGLTAEVGIAPRPERLIVLAAGLVIAGALGGVGYPVPTAGALGVVGYPVPGAGNPGHLAGATALAVALGIVVLTCAITIAQRIVHVHDQSNGHR